MRGRLQIVLCVTLLAGCEQTPPHPAFEVRHDETRESVYDRWDLTYGEHITVRTVPSGMDVYIQSKYVGRSPVDVTLGLTPINAIREGFRTDERNYVEAHWSQKPAWVGSERIAEFTYSRSVSGPAWEGRVDMRLRPIDLVIDVEDPKLGNASRRITIDDREPIVRHALDTLYLGDTKPPEWVEGTRDFAFIMLQDATTQPARAGGAATANPPESR